jgi:multidrug efflux system membrane fusion protein
MLSLIRRAPMALVGLAAVFAATSPVLAQMPGAGGPPPVTVAKPIVKEIVEWDEFVGRFEATNSVEIRARVAGYLEASNFREGALVKENDLLFVIDKRPYQAAYARAQAAVASAQTRTTFTRSDLERTESLTRSGVAAERTLEERRQQSQQAGADLQAARAALEQARLDLEFTEIRAQISGRIGRRMVTEGNLVRANDTLLTTIVSLDPIHFYFEVDERSYLAYSRHVGPRTALGEAKTQVFVGVADEKTLDRPGMLDFADNRLDSRSGTLQLRAVFANKELLLTPGLFGRVRIPGSPRYKAVLVPDEAISADQDRRIVLVVGDDGVVAPKVVRPGPREDGYRVIREGLTGEESIVINGLQRARPGTKVTPQPTTLPPSR